MDCWIAVIVVVDVVVYQSIYIVDVGCIPPHPHPFPPPTHPHPPPLPTHMSLPTSHPPTHLPTHIPLHYPLPTHSRHCRSRVSLAIASLCCYNRTIPYILSCQGVGGVWQIAGCTSRICITAYSQGGVVVWLSVCVVVWLSVCVVECMCGGVYVCMVWRDVHFL